MGIQRDIDAARNSLVAPVGSEMHSEVIPMASGQDTNPQCCRTMDRHNWRSIPSREAGRRLGSMIDRMTQCPAVDFM